MEWTCLDWMHQLKLSPALGFLRPVPAFGPISYAAAVRSHEAWSALKYTLEILVFVSRRAVAASIRPKGSPKAFRLLVRFKKPWIDVVNLLGLCVDNDESTKPAWLSRVWLKMANIFLHSSVALLVEVLRNQVRHSFLVFCRAERWGASHSSRE